MKENINNVDELNKEHSINLINKFNHADDNYIFTPQKVQNINIISQNDNINNIQNIITF